VQANPCTRGRRIDGARGPATGSACRGGRL